MQNNKYYYVQQNSTNDLQIATIQTQTGCNIVSSVPIKVGVSPIVNQQGENLFIFAIYNEIECDFSAEIHNELLAIQGTQFFDNANQAREFKQNGFIN